MKIINSYSNINELQPQQNILLKEGQLLKEGRWFKWKRVFVLKTNEKYAVVSVNFFERSARLFLSIFKIDYFRVFGDKKIFGNKKIEVISLEQLERESARFIQTAAKIKIVKEEPFNNKQGGFNNSSEGEVALRDNKPLPMPPETSQHLDKPLIINEESTEDDQLDAGSKAAMEDKPEIEAATLDASQSSDTTLIAGEKSTEDAQPDTVSEELMENESDIAVASKNKSIREAISKSDQCTSLSGISNITSKDIDKICKGISRLYWLMLNNCENFTGASAIESEHLGVLELNNTNVTNQEIETILGNCPSLHVLELSNCKNIGNDIEILGCELTKINLEGTNVTDEDINFLLKNCPKLSKLDLSNCKQITGSFIQNLSPSVTKLSLEGINLSNASIESLEQIGFSFDWSWVRPKNTVVKSEELPDLDKTNYLENKIFQALKSSHMKLSQISNLTDKDIIKIFHRCPALTELELNNCDKFTGGPAIESKNLIKLSLSDVDVTNEDIELILNNCPNLKSLSLSNCDKISQTHLDRLKKKGLSISWSQSKLTSYKNIL